MRRSLLCLILLATPGVLACAARHHQPRFDYDLLTAQSIIANARALGAETRAPEVLARAETLLEDAVKEDNATRRDWLERLAVAEANHALSMTELKRELEGLSEELARVKQVHDNELQESRREYRKLEDRVDVLLRDLELTEAEIIRTKARLKGLETRAEASSAFAEARILIRRASSDRFSASALGRCQELLARAEEQLRLGNYGAAAFFALKVQDLLRNAQRSPLSRSEHERPVPSTKP